MLQKNKYQENDKLYKKNEISNIRSQVFKSLELYENVNDCNESSNSSEGISSLAINDLEQNIETTETSSSCEINMNSPFSVSMSCISTRSNRNCTLKSEGKRLFDVKNFENMTDNAGLIFVSELNNYKIIESPDTQKNFKHSSICDSDEGKKTSSPNVLPKENSLNSEMETLASRCIESNAKKHVCADCSKVFKYPSQLNRHSKSHNINKNRLKPEARKKCLGSASKNKKNIDFYSEASIYFKVNNGKCPHCSKSFKFPSKLLRHIKTHEGQKPYTCPMCSKAFLEKFNLTAHIKNHENLKTYTCEICERKFNCKSNFTRHIRSHIKEKQFTCSKCGKSCRSEKQLAIHFRIHQEVSRKCPVCLKVFKKSSNLKRHIEIHFKEI